ncbi:MAG TPA: NAD-dependent epimerase/dehydratase family protein [Paracoccaceae bacterium]|nr:NAD-dependent epimerase/dehydratase family protein [Paracoccaceae bacterium]
MPPVFVVGATGRIGRVLRSVWGPEAAVWQARRDVPGHVTWDVLGGNCPVSLRDSVVLCLAGVTRGDALGLNTDLALAVMRAAEAGGAARVLVASSAAVYAPADRDMAEGDAPDPQSPYGRAKAAMEAAVLAAPGPARCLLRIGNVVGADALIGGARAGVPVVLDPVPGAAGGPLRSWIGPVTLARVLWKLCEIVDLPPVLNVAQPGPLRMAALLEAAGMGWSYGPVRPGVVGRATLDVTCLSGLSEPVLPPATADGLIAEWRGSGL